MCGKSRQRESGLAACRFEVRYFQSSGVRVSVPQVSSSTTISSSGPYCSIAITSFLSLRYYRTTNSFTASVATAAIVAAPR